MKICPGCQLENTRIVDGVCTWCGYPATMPETRRMHEDVMGELETTTWRTPREGEYTNTVTRAQIIDFAERVWMLGLKAGRS